MPFVCSICGEESVRICVRCTKDACNNHLCEKCLRCSDCCECEVTLSEQPPTARSVMPKHERVPAPEPWIDDELETEEPENDEPGIEPLQAEAMEIEAPQTEPLPAESPDADELKPPGT